MSSEDEEKDGTFSVRSLPWRSQIFGTIIQELDAKAKNTASKKSLLQTQRRKVGELSRHPKPTEIDVKTSGQYGNMYNNFL